MSFLSPRFALRSSIFLGLAPVLVAGGCFKTLDESLMDQTDGSAGTGAVDGGGSGGSGGTGGTGGTGAKGGTGGTGATGGTGGDSGIPDAQPDGGIIAYDSTKYPVKNLALGEAPVVIASDDTDAFFATKNKLDSLIRAQPLQPLDGATGKTLTTSHRPQALAAPTSSAFLFVGGGQSTGEQGTLLRLKKDGTSTEIITPATSFELVAGLAAASDSFIYVSTKASAAGGVALLRFGFVATLTEDLYTATAPESGGDVDVAGGCVYWISNGMIWVIKTDGGPRSAALSTAITDAVGVATDATHLFFTRADGSVWRRVLSSAACDGSGTPESQLASGFTAIGDLVTHDGRVTWVATGDKTASYAGGGVFSMSASGGVITQIGPSELGPSDIDQSSTDIVFATDTGAVRRVPKQPK